MTSEPYYPPPAFGFTAWLSPDTLPQSQPSIDAAFQEVSGIDLRVLSEDATEGGVNRYTHQLPGIARHSNLVLKRGYVTRASALARWAEQVASSTLDTPVSTSAVGIALLRPDGQPLVTWRFEGAWPVKWEVGPLDTTRDEILTETLEIAYTVSTRITSG